MILIYFFLGAGPPGSLLPGSACVALVLHYFLGWRNPPLGGKPTNARRIYISICMCRIVCFCFPYIRKEKSKVVVLIKSSNGRCRTNFPTVCKISLHVSSWYQNLGVNVRLAKLSKWRQSNMHLIHTSHHWNHDPIYMCDVLHAYVTNNIV